MMRKNEFLYACDGLGWLTVFVFKDGAEDGVALDDLGERFLKGRIVEWTSDCLTGRYVIRTARPLELVQKP